MDPPLFWGGPLSLVLVVLAWLLQLFTFCPGNLDFLGFFAWVSFRDVVKYVFIFVNTQKLIFVFVSENFKTCIFVFEPCICCICIKYSQIQYTDMMKIADFNSHTKN